MKTILFLLFALLFQSCKSDLENVNPDVDNPPQDDGSKIEFTEEQLRLPGKKGACFTLNETNSVQNMNRVAALKVKWNYSWGSKRVTNQLKDVEFVPMTWGRFTPSSIVPGINLQIENGYTKRILGFNEPDGEKQANMSVEQALELWPTLQSFKIPIGSPAPVDGRGEWLEEFMQGVDENGYRVDYICIHIYQGTSLSSFQKYVNDVYEKYKKPILITEFAVADWNAKTVEENRYSKEQVLKFMKEVLPWLEETEYVYGYAWFSFGTDSPQGCTSALFDENGQLTELGRYYSDFEGSTTSPEPEPEPEPEDPVNTGENLIINPGFESGIDDGSWIKSQWNVYLDSKIENPDIADNIISGNCTVTLTGDWAEIKQNITLDKNKKYICGCTARVLKIGGPSGGESTGGSSGITFTLNYINESGQKVKINSKGTSSNVNTDVKFQFEITDNMTCDLELSISKWTNEYLKSSVAYIDDVYLKEIQE